MNLEPLLHHLGVLIGFNTQNPPRDLNEGSPIWSYISASLGSEFDVRVIDHDLGRVSYLAVRGTPDLLFNVHLDTVPVLSGAKFDPLVMTESKGRVYGRGACDIKGAAACLLHLAQTSSVPMALLFTTDEEGAQGCCVRRFTESGHSDPYRQVIVAEPTGCLAQTRHRGYLSVTGEFCGVSGHSSEARALSDSAIHRFSRWSAAALEESARLAGTGHLSCFNIGTVKGGVKSNVIADRLEVHWSARLPPGSDTAEFFGDISAQPGGEHAQWAVPFSGPPLPDRAEGEREALDFAMARGLQMGDGLDFWTEASLFSASGTPALVLGPGHIEQAHVVDEWVSVDQLERAFHLYANLVGAHA